MKSKFQNILLCRQDTTGTANNENITVQNETETLTEKSGKSLRCSVQGCQNTNDKRAMHHFPNVFRFKGGKRLINEENCER